MSDELDALEIQERPSRPGFLTVLCVLSFISIGLGLVSGLINLLSGPMDEEQMLASKVEMTASLNELKSTGMDSMSELMMQIQAMSEQINQNFYLASILTLLTLVIGLVGVLNMWKGVKKGFHFYIVYCLLSIGAMYVYVSPENIPSVVVIFNLLISALFIFMYSRNLKWMN